MGFPIRKSSDQSLFAAPQRLSQRITSFIACACQGIHRMPLLRLIILIANAHPYLILPAPLRHQNDPVPTLMETPNGPDPCKDQNRSKNLSYLLQLRPCQMSSTCSDPAYPINAPAFIKHGSLRPASRDLSGDARSGNANQITQSMKQASKTKQSI